ncbi:ABC transporter substrate-binding protein [Marinobacter sp. F4206]|uniref:ABC transporter substrate-binding protein n=1 Tax=Marinobacter sp. F4206 TaxID=2861777 RepID=UPI001C5E03D0|nr:ABC transporter substrate-binding protein [Marinobacter sp. F4206]MBW4934639.1 ABC transporter substrate-binding protein [Marinobacter sp. F4206]
MRKITSAVLLCAAAAPGLAQANQCGEVSITEMNWASASVVTNVAKFMMEQGYGCEVNVVPSDTVPAVTSVAENGEPDIVTELWLNSTGEVYERLEAEGKVERLGKVLTPGGVEGWWIPTYLVEAHPELKTIEGIMANPELVDARFNNCPDGWGCRIVNDNLIRALDLESSGIEVFNHGSGETLASSMASAVGSEEPWFGYYWGPTVPLGKFDMTRVDLGEYDEAAHTANQNQDNANPKVSDFPAAPVLTSVTTDFREREPEVADMLSKMTFETDTMSQVLAWKSDNNASAEEAAVYFLSNNSNTWKEWLNDSAREKLAAILSN